MANWNRSRGHARKQLRLLPATGPTVGVEFLFFVPAAAALSGGRCAPYAYLRHVDDLGDDDGRDVAVRRATLEALRGELLVGGKNSAPSPRHSESPAETCPLPSGEGYQSKEDYQSKSVNPILPALMDTVARYRIPREYLTAVIDGVEMDLAGQQYQTFEELELYCERVASVVGLACIHIWGFRGPEALEPARRCGVAFQLTNILRDLKEDGVRGRIYLPQEDLRRFAYRPEELLGNKTNSQFFELMKFEIARTEQFYAAAAELDPLLDSDGRRCFER